METEFGILPWLLLAAITFLLGHSFTGKHWKVISRVGLISIFMASAITFQYSVEEIKSETVLFVSQVSLFVTFIAATLTVGVRETLSALLEI